MSSHTVIPVIMAGGSGTRLWPLSRAGYPKQFLVLGHDPEDRSSLFQQAVRRLTRLSDAGLNVGAPLIVGNEDHRFLVLDQLREMDVAPRAATPHPPSPWPPCRPPHKATTRSW